MNLSQCVKRRGKCSSKAPRPQPASISRAALEQYREGRIDLAPPQIMSLAHLARHADVASVLAEARSKAPALVQPEPFDDEQGVRVLCYPGDPRHSVPERALPGPTRLRYQGRRFLPGGGFEALFL